ncbi:MAG: sigma-70 family RNA polymerase sigma factor [bacterium]|nr:sigma-70 family RNA polymerase sigma factor [bacterium]
MDRASDGQLIAQYLHGDRVALDALIRRHLQRVYRFVLRYARNPQDAEEITQETFVRAWRTIARFDRERSFTTWLLQIAKHAAIDVLRKRTRTIPTVELDDMHALGDPAVRTDNIAPRLEALLGRAEDARVLTVALERLPSHDRIVLILRYQRELTFREIGSALGEPLHTVKSRHRRALVRLRTSLGQLGMDASTSV